MGGSRKIFGQAMGGCNTRVSCSKIWRAPLPFVYLKPANWAGSLFGQITAYI